MNNPKPLRILLVGPSLTQNGGMASVQKLIVKSAGESIHTEHITTHEEGSALCRARIFAIALVRFIWKLLQGNIDLVHLHVSEKGSVFRKLLLLRLAKAFNKPVLMHTHGCEFHTFHDDLSQTMRHFVDSALQEADCLIALSESWKQYYVSECGLNSSQVLVLSNPVEIREPLPTRLRSEAQTLNFIFLGRIGERKGAFDLIRAFASMPNRKNARLLIAGDGEIETAAALIESLKLQDSVQLLGWIDEAQRRCLLDSAHVFVLPSHNEGLPMSMLEAMAAGLPIITTPVGGIPEFLTEGESGYLVAPGDVAELTRAMIKLAESEALRFSMGQHARERVRPLDLTLYGKTLAEIYRLLLGPVPLERLPIDTLSLARLP